MAGGAGGHEAERLSVKVVPDTGGFKEKLQGFLDELEAKSKLKINLELTNEAQVREKLARLTKDLTVHLAAELDERLVREKLARLAKDMNVHLAAEVDDALAKAKLAELTRDRTVKIKVELDASLAKAEMLLLAKDRHTTIHVRTDKNNFQQITKDLEGVAGAAGQAAGSLGGQLSKAGGQATGVMGQLSGAFETISSFSGPLMVVIIGLLVGAVIGLVIAVGALVGALALVALPAAFLAIGVMFDVMTAKGKRTSQKIKDAFGSIAKTAKGVISSAVKPMTDAIARQVPQINSWIRSLQGPLKSAFSSAAKYVPALTKALELFGTNMLSGIVTALQNPQMKQAVDGFGKFMAQLGYSIGLLFSTLANNGAAFGKTLDAMGAAFVKIMPAFGSFLGALATVAPDVIQQLATSLVHLLEMLSNPQVLSALTAFANISFQAIEFAIIALTGYIYGLVQDWRIAKALIEATWNGIVAAARWVWGVLTSGWSILGSMIVSLWNRIRSAVVGAAQATGQGVISAFLGFFGAVVGVWARIISACISGANRAKAGALGAFHGIASGAASIIGGIVGVFASVWGRISSIVSSIIGAVGRARAAVSGIGGLLSKLNPLNMAGPSLSIAGGGVYTAPVSPMGSLISDLGRMTYDTNRLSRLASSFASGTLSGSIGATSQPASKTYNVTVMAAPTVPTEKTIIKALGYADDLYS